MILMRYISIFSGIEAASVAWGPLGWEPVAFAEIEPFPCAVLAERFPNVPNLGSVIDVDWSGYSDGSVDVLVGGSPCQSFSIAGKREGLQGESRLMFEYIRAVREVRPHYFIWENVPGAFTSDNGEAFRQLLSEMDGLGYGLAWRVLDAQFFGVAQRRRRVFLVGVLGDGAGAAEVLFERDCLQWDHPSSREKRKSLTAAAKGCAFCMASGQANAEIEWDMAPAQAARQYKDPQIVVMADDNAKAAIDFDLCGSLKVGCSAPIAASGYVVRRLTPRECERLQGFPDDWTLIDWKGKGLENCPDAPRYKALGNSMAVPVMRWIGRRLQAYDVLHGTRES